MLTLMLHEDAKQELETLSKALTESDATLLLKVKGEKEARAFHQRGVKDLYDLVTDMPQVLEEALLADKVVGKGAAALMVMGKVAAVHTKVISTPALELLKKHGIPCMYDTEVEHIWNRDKTDFCPVEKRCIPLSKISECYNSISEFIHSQNSRKC